MTQPVGHEPLYSFTMCRKGWIMCKWSEQMEMVALDGTFGWDGYWQFQLNRVLLNRFIHHYIMYMVQDGLGQLRSNRSEEFDGMGSNGPDNYNWVMLSE